MADVPMGGRDLPPDSSDSEAAHPEGDSADPGDRRPTLSVCVPTFNRPELVQRAIRSIVASAAGHERDVEIVVSDNSPAVSEQACRDALAAWGGRSSYVGNRPDIGLTANLNQCIDRASGRHIVFVHDDDRLRPEAIPTILKALAAHQKPAAVLLFGVDVVDEHGGLVRRQRFCREEWIAVSDALHRLLSDNGLAWFPGVVVSREAYAAVGPFDAGVGNATDFEMWVRLFARFGVRCVPGTISAYSVHAGSATQSMSIDAEAIGNLMEIFERARQTGILSAETIRRCQARYVDQVILGAAYVDLRAGNVGGARRSLAAFDLPAVKSLGQPPEWLPVRWISALLVRSPSGVVRPVMRLVDRLGLVRWVRAFGNRGPGQLPLC